MRRIVLLAVAALATLAVAGLALAQLTTTGTEAVSATFTATNVVRSDTRTCTGTDGTYEITHARYDGQATSATAGLAGSLQIRVKSVYNTTEKLGWVDGTLYLRGDDRRAVGHFSAVNTNGVLDGFVAGHLNRRVAVLRGSLTAGFTRTGGFTDGKLGTGSATNTALLTGQICKGKSQPASVRLSVRGTVEAITSSSISVKPRDGSVTQTCAIVAGTSPGTNGVDPGEDVEITCGLVNGAMTLLKIHRR
jgi:hypothetical protein